jgi:hypothetical protein
MAIANARTFEYDACVKQLGAYEKKGEANLTPAQKQNRESIEIFIAENLQDEVKEAATVARSFPVVTRARGEQRLAERAIARHPTRTPEEVKKAEKVVEKVLESNMKGLAEMQPFRAQWALAVFMTSWSSAVIAVFAVIGALVTRSGFTLRGLGAALVNTRGEDASRLRALWRAIATWAPAALAILVLRAGPKMQDATIAAVLLQTLPLLLLAAGALWAIRHPSRGFQDRLAGTTIVPR